MGEEDATAGLAGRNVGGQVQGAKAPKHQTSEGQREQPSSLEWVLGAPVSSQEDCGHACMPSAYPIP